MRNVTEYKYPYRHLMTEVVPGTADLLIERMVFVPSNLEGHSRGMHSPNTSGLFG